jgi:hypothetical protein
MFDTDDESDMDLMQAADATCRKYDSIMMKKQQRGEELRLAMNEIERQGLNQLEFNDVEWMRLDDQLRALRRSWLKFSIAFKVALKVRHAIAGHTGSRWGEYRTAAEFKAQRASDIKRRMAVVPASTAVGLDPIQFKAWQEWRQHYDPQVDGVDADPDASGPTAADQKALADRQHQQQLAEKGVRRKYLRNKPTVVPKPDSSFEPSGKPGSRHRDLVAKIKAGGE